MTCSATDAHANSRVVAMMTSAMRADDAAINAVCSLAAGRGRLDAHTAESFAKRAPASWAQVLR